MYGRVGWTTRTVNNNILERTYSITYTVPWRTNWLFSNMYRWNGVGKTEIEKTEGEIEIERERAKNIRLESIFAGWR